MIVAGLEAAEEVFLTLDPQQQLEAFVSDGETVEDGKVIARTSGFADVLIAGERVALNLIQRLSGVATVTSKFVQAVSGTQAQIVDTRETTPGLRLLERYAFVLGGGRNSRFGLDDGVVITANHVAVAGGIAACVKNAREQLGSFHRIQVQAGDEAEAKEAASSGADGLLLENLEPEVVARLSVLARELAPTIAIECSGSSITLENVRAYAEAGATLIGISAGNRCTRGVEVSFQLQPF
jgi:nicotinate-nucleotide pyrophosphorylase (carboxylating)